MLISKFYDIPYIWDGDAAHTLDISYPRDAAAPLPVIVDIHGGGWAFGDKSMNRNYCSALVRLGFCVVNINYRQLPFAPLKDQVWDIFTALHTLPGFAEEHPMDMTKVFLAGDSAGGQLALLCAAIAAKPQLQRAYYVNELPFSITALGLSSPVPFIEEVGNVPGFESTPGMLLYDLPRSMWGVEELLSGCALPPVFIISAEDDWDWHSHSPRLAEALSRANLPCRYLPFRAEDDPLGHVFNVTLPHSPMGSQANSLMADFFLSLIE